MLLISVPHPTLTSTPKNVRDRKRVRLDLSLMPAKTNYFVIAGISGMRLREIPPLFYLRLPDNRHFQAFSFSNVNRLGGVFCLEFSASGVKRQNMMPRCFIV